MTMRWFLALALVASLGCTKAEAPVEATKPAKEKKQKPEKVEEDEPEEDEPEEDEPRKTPPTVAENAPPEGPAEVPEPEAKPAEAPAPEAKPAEIAPVSAEVGPAYFGTKSAGVLKLDAGALTPVVTGLTNVRSVLVSSDGTLFVASIGKVQRIRGDKPELIGNFDSPGSIDNLALAPDGHLIATSFKGVHEWDGKAWTLEEKAKLGEEVKLLNGAAIDAKGRVWVVSSNTIHVREGGAWRAIDTGTKKLFFKDIGVGASGAVYANHSSGAVKVVDDKSEPVKLGAGFLTLGGLAVGARDTLHLSGYGMLIVAPAGGEVRRFTSENGDFKGKHIGAVAGDALGRTWAATDNGLVVVDAAGKVTQWLPGTLKGLTDEVETITLVRGGPALPEVSAQAKGTVKGKVLRTGSGVADAPVEICASPSSLFSVSPCHDAAFKLATKTDADGAFTFNDVPLGTYRFAVKPGDKWTITMSACCAKMQEGKSFDIGSIDLSP